MKTSLEMLLVCWSSFALAFDNPFTAGELRLPQFLTKARSRICAHEGVRRIPRFTFADGKFPTI